MPVRFIQPSSANLHLPSALPTLLQSAWIPIVELGMVTIVILAYCAKFLNFETTQFLPGNEAELFQFSDWTLFNSLTHYRQFPLWNPYLRTGLPFVADPMLHSYNLFVTVPVLVLGVHAGFKVAVALSFLIAALGMWRLGRILDLGTPARIWVALMYALAGQPTARFFQGEYLFVFGFAWIPWIIAGLFLVAKTRERRHVAGLILTLALLFFCGNAYYQFLTLFIIGIFLLMALLQLPLQTRSLKIDLRLIGSFGIVGLLAIGVIALQLLPLIEFWPHTSQSKEVYGSHNLAQIFLDYTSKDSYRPDAYTVLPAREEFYAYIGLPPFLLLSLLPLTIWKRDRWPLVFFGLVVLFTILWIDLDQMPWREAFIETGFLTQFRHLLRALIFGSLAVILLAGFSMDTAWQIFKARLPSFHTWRWRMFVSLVGMACIFGVMGLSVYDLFITNQPYLGTLARDRNLYNALNWLRQYDSSDYYIRLNPNNIGYDPVASNRLRMLDAWYPLPNLRQPSSWTATRAFEALPEYIIQEQNAPAPPYAGVKLLAQVEGYNIYHLIHSLPIAFSVRADILLRNAPASGLRHWHITPVSKLQTNPNSVEIIATSQGNQVLILLYSYYPDWNITVDGNKYPASNFNGYLGTIMKPGEHRYVFNFQPRLFYVGLVVSLISIGFTLALLFHKADRPLIPCKPAISIRNT